MRRASYGGADARASPRCAPLSLPLSALSRMRLFAHLRSVASLVCVVGASRVCASARRSPRRTESNYKQSRHKRTRTKEKVIKYEDLCINVCVECGD
jgi:hypothetical protein